MYLHIGNGVSIRDKDIIGVFDLDTATVSKITKKYISDNEKDGRVEYTDFDLPRSFVVFEDNKKGNYKIRLSRISTVGLKQRTDGEIKGLGE